MSRYHLATVPISTPSGTTNVVCEGAYTPGSSGRFSGSAEDCDPGEPAIFEVSHLRIAQGSMALRVPYEDAESVLALFLGAPKADELLSTLRRDAAAAFEAAHPPPPDTGGETA